MSQLEASFDGPGRPDNENKIFDQSNDMNILDDGSNNILGDVYGNGLDTMNAQSGFNFDETDDFLKSISGVLGNNKPDLANINLNNVNYNNSTLSPSSINGEEVGFPEYLGAYPDQPQATFQSGLLEQPLYATRIRSHSSSIATYNGENISPLSNNTNDTSDYTSPESVQNHVIEKPPVKQTKRGSASKVTKPKNPKDKSSHNMIEKKYRTNINSKILILRDAVPALRIAAGAEDVSLADLEGITPASKLNKASVLTKATEYIKHLEQKNAMLKDQNEYLQKVLQEANLSSQIQMPLAQRPIPSSPMDGSQQIYGDMRPNSLQSYDHQAYMHNQQVAAGQVAPLPVPPPPSSQQQQQQQQQQQLSDPNTKAANSPVNFNTSFDLLDYKSLTLENKGSVARDHMANERTFLAWLRTSLAFITIGIGVTQLFRLEKPGTKVHTTDRIIELLMDHKSDDLKRYGKPLGSIFIVLGILTLIMGFKRYFHVQRLLTKSYYPAARLGIGILLFLILSVVLVTLALVMQTSLQ